VVVVVVVVMDLNLHRWTRLFSPDQPCRNVSIGGKDKVTVHPRTGHEDPEGGKRCSSTLS
jgi:hypothetical protein